MAKTDVSVAEVPPIIEFLLCRVVEDQEVLERHKQTAPHDGCGIEMRAYVTHFNPQRQAAAVAACLALLMLHRPDEDGRCRECGDAALGPDGRWSYPCSTLRRMTWPFERHQDYDRSWGAASAPEPGGGPEGTGPGDMTEPR